MRLFISYPRTVLVAQYETQVHSKYAPAQQNPACPYCGNDKITEVSTNKSFTPASSTSRHFCKLMNLHFQIFHERLDR